MVEVSHFFGYKVTCEGLKRCFFQEDNEEMSVLEQLRRKRLSVRKIVEEMNYTFNKTAFLSLFANVPLIVFIVYALYLHGHERIFTLAMGIIAIIISLLQVGIVCVSAAWINQWVSAPPPHLGNKR